MTWTTLQWLSLAYLAGLLAFHLKNWRLLFYIWAAFGFAFLFTLVSILQEWHVQLAIIEGQHLLAVSDLFGQGLEIVDDTIVLVPDPTGWTGLDIGIECSTLIELSVLTGLIMFYPRLAFQKRWTYLGIGIVGTYVLNLVRIMVIVWMIHLGGKPLVPLAHTVVGRLVYFAGVVALYWYLLTKPTLALVNRSIEVSGRAVR